MLHKSLAEKCKAHLLNYSNARINFHKQISTGHRRLPKITNGGRGQASK